MSVEGLSTAAARAEQPEAGPDEVNEQGREVAHGQQRSNRPAERNRWKTNASTLQTAIRTPQVVRHPIEDPSRRYYDKLDEQLKNQMPQVVHLAAEVMWLLMLFPARIKGKRKHEDM